MDEVDFYLEDLKSKFRKLKNVGGYNKYYLSYSGGKDSHLLYWFIKEYSYPEFKDIKIVGINTFMEHHEILQRIKNNCDIVLVPKMKPFEIKEKYGIPCFSKMQDEMIHRWQIGKRTPSTIQFVMGTKNNGNTMFRLSKKAKRLLLNNQLHKISNLCCYYLKKEPNNNFKQQSGLNQILGVRSGESLMRKAQYKSCFSKDNTFTPLHDLSDELEEKIYKKYNIEIPKVYEQVKRTGCMGCPYGSHYGDTEKELALLNEAQRKFVMKYFKESYEVLGIHLQTNIFDFIEE